MSPDWDRFILSLVLFKLLPLGFLYNLTKLQLGSLPVLIII